MLLAVLGGGLLLTVAVAGLIYTAIRIPLPASIVEPEQVRVTYADGSPLGTIGQVNRTDVPIASVPLDVQHDVLAAEDRNFYHEAGISVRGIGRAFLADVFGGRISQGGSTITQQYAKNAYLGQQRTFSRKIEEIVLAIKLANKYSKSQILEDYLNTIYFGRGAYGIQAASEAYFGQPVNALDLAQGAVLAGLIRAPSYLDPALHPRASRTRWQEVINTMVRQHWLSSAQAATLPYPAVIAPPTSATRTRDNGPTSYIDAQVATFLRTQLGAATLDLGGLTVTTTIDKTAQAAAISAVAAQTRGAPASLRAALISVDPSSGAIRAYYGGGVANEADSVSFLTAPPGSSFKPIVLATALGEGIKLSQTYNGASPQTFSGTTVRNFADEQFGQINLITATAQSVNTVYVHLNLDAGPQRVVDLAHQLGIRASTTLNPVGTLALGEDYVHPYDMAEVYSTLAARGMQAAPYLVSKVVDRDGHTLFSANPAPIRVLPQAVADDTTFALEHVLSEGTAVASQLNGREAAGKTGTTTGALPNIAAWFDGYTPQLATVVALLNPGPGGAPQSILPWPGCGCAEVTGATVPAHVWKQFMDAALAGQPDLTLPVPSDVATPSPASSSPPSSSSPAPSTTTPSTSAPPTSSSASPSVSPSISLSVPFGSSSPSSGSGSTSPSPTASASPSATGSPPPSGASGTPAPSP